VSSFWRGLVRFEREKIAPVTALRNAVGVAIPLLAGYAVGNTNSGLVGGTGALNVAFTDGRDPYLPRAERMVAASVLCASAVFIGSLTGGHAALAVVLAFGWAFAAGLLVALDQTAADVGTISLVTLIVFSSHALPPDQALSAGVLAFSGGLLQTGLSVAMWPLRRFEAEQRALGALYSELGRSAAEPVEARAAPPATQQASDAQKALASVSAGRNVHAVRYLLLLSQAERIRLSLLFLGRLRLRLQNQSKDTDEPPQLPLDEYVALTARVLDSIGAALSSGGETGDNEEWLRRMHGIAEEVRRTEAVSQPAIAATLSEIIHSVEALTGQARAAADLAASATHSGRVDFERIEQRRPIRLRLIGTWPTLRANLTLSSAACRHALRLAVCVGIAETVARTSGLERAYWIPMTAAIILKPDFTATFSRGLQRLAGTFAGLVIATALFYVLPVAFWTEVSLITAFMFLLRCFGPANYGILTAAVSALVVALLAMTGVPPSETISARGVATVAGGALALAIYAVWPTWEHTQIPEVMARMLDAYREYFHVIREAFLFPSKDFSTMLDQKRHRARLERSNVEASVERYAAEPNVSPEMVSAWTSVLASSHRMIHAVMAMEAGLMRSEPVPARPAFRPFAHDVEVTLHSLASALRGTRLDAAELPDLREDHHTLVESGDPETERYALVNIESDRITNSLNTLSMQLMALVTQPHQTSPGAR